MSVALYATVWLSILLFVVGEAGKLGSPPRRWAWHVYGLGAVFCAVHMLLAMGTRHGWSHQSAIESTAAQTQAVYGLNWGGGVYVNYVFLAVWIGELIWWATGPTTYLGRPLSATWSVRTFYLIVLVNAAVVFASGFRAVAGLLLIVSLLWIWRPASR
jgi:hypothetical protein